MWRILLGLILVWGLAAHAVETPKRGGTLTFMIPADAPPTFDGHRETTYATAHAIAPFYSLLMRLNPENPSDTSAIVCDLCTEIPQPTDGGKVWTFRIRDGVKWHDGSPLTAIDVATSWRRMVSPPPGILSSRAGHFSMVERVEAPDARTVVFTLKFPSSAFLTALADPLAFIYKKEILDRDQHWYEKNVMGSGPFKFVEMQIGQSLTGVRNPDFYRPNEPYLDGFVAIFAPKMSVEIDAIRADRAAGEFRGLPPSARDQLVKELGDKIAVQTSDWNCSNIVTTNHARKPFDDVRVRKALALALDQWGGATALSRIAVVHAVGGIVFPGSPLAATKAELQQLPGYWPDIEKSRAEARRLLKEAGAEGLSFELLNRNVDQPFKYLGVWLVDEWAKIGVKVTQKIVPGGPQFDLFRKGDFEVGIDFNCRSPVNPPLDVSKYLPRPDNPDNYGNYDDPRAIALYDTMLKAPDAASQRVAMRAFEKHVLDTEAHGIVLPWWERNIPMRSYVKGWKIGPSHFANQDLSSVWLDR